MSTKEDFNSDIKDSYALTAEFRSKGNLVKTDPQSAAEVMNEVEDLMKSDQNNEYSYRAAFDTLAEIIKVDSKFGQKALKLTAKVIEKPLLSKTEGFRFVPSKTEGFRFLGKLVQISPELAPEALKLIEGNATSGGISISSCEAASDALRTIAEIRPDLKDKASQTLKITEQVQDKITPIEQVEIIHGISQKVYRNKETGKVRARIKINPDKQDLIDSAKDRIAAKTAKTAEEPEKPTPSNGGNVPPINNGNDGR